MSHRTCNFTKNPCQTVFQSHSILHSHQQCMRLPTGPWPCQFLIFSVFLHSAILVGVYWYLLVVLICISLWLIILSVFSFADQPSKHLLVKYPFKSLAGAFHWVTVSRLSCKLFSIDSGPKSFVNYLHYIYFLLGLRVLFFFLMVSFEKKIQYFKIFDEVQLMFFLLVFELFVS